MKVFRKRETPIENLAFMGVASALVGIFALTSSFSVIASLALMLALPLISALVALICKWRYLPLYLISSIAVSTLLSFASFQNEILFVIPAILLGVTYGMLERSKLGHSISLFVCALLEFGLFYLSIVIIKAIYEVDMVEFLLRFIGRQKDGVADMIFPCFALAYAFAQIAILHLVFEFTFSRFSLQEKVDFLKPYYFILGIVFFGACMIFAFFAPAVAYILFGFALYWTVFSLGSFFEKPLPIPAILMVSSILITLLVASLIYRYMPPYTGMLLYGMLFVFVDFASFLNDLLLRKRK